MQNVMTRVGKRLTLLGVVGGLMGVHGLLNPRSADAQVSASVPYVRTSYDMRANGFSLRLEITNQIDNHITGQIAGPGGGMVVGWLDGNRIYFYRFLDVAGFELQFYSGTVSVSQYTDAYLLLQGQFSHNGTGQYSWEARGVIPR